MLRSGLWGGADDEVTSFPLTAEEWKKVREEAARQAVIGTIFSGICLLPEQLMPDEGELSVWMALADKTERRNGKMGKVLKDLTAKFVKGGLHPVLQKGLAVARYYPRPELRSSGDIDLYFGEDLGKAVRLIEAEGTEANRTGMEGREAEDKKVRDAKSREVEVREAKSREVEVREAKSGEAEVREAKSGEAEGREAKSGEAEGTEAEGISVNMMPDGSGSFVWEGIDIELHGRLLDLRSSEKLVREAPCGGFEPTPLADGLRVPSPEITALLLNAHILKHALGKGIGLRQLCDLAMFYHSMFEAAGTGDCGTNGCGEARSEGINEYVSGGFGERVRELYRKAGILKWSTLLHSYLVEVIGLPEYELPYSETLVAVEPLRRIVDAGGNFGQHGKVREGGRKNEKNRRDAAGEKNGNGRTGGGGREKEKNRRDAAGEKNGNGRTGGDGRKKDGKNGGVLRRKMRTAGAFVKRARFSFEYAPAEALSLVRELFLGQFRRKKQRQRLKQ